MQQESEESVVVVPRTRAPKLLLTIGQALFASHFLKIRSRHSSAHSKRPRLNCGTRLFFVGFACRTPSVQATVSTSACARNEWFTDLLILFTGAGRRAPSGGSQLRQSLGVAWRCRGFSSPAVGPTTVLLNPVEQVAATPIPCLPLPSSS